jgi:hypothetical protein
MKPQLTLRDLFWLVLVVAVFTSWGIDRSRLATRIDGLEHPAVLPSPYTGFDSVQYFPPGPEFPLSKDAPAPSAYKVV